MRPLPIVRPRVKTLGCFRGNLDKILQRHDAWKFRKVVFYCFTLYSDALSHSCTKLGNWNFMFKFAEHESRPYSRYLPV